jgi:hypothetical protein
MPIIPVRNPIADALLAREQSICGANFATYSRTFETYIDLLAKLTGSNQGDPPAFPALYLYEGVGFGESGQTKWDQRGPGVGVSVRTLNFTLVIYALKPKANTPDGADITVAGSVALNDLVELVESTFTPDDFSTNTLTLGKLCRHCWIEGIGELISGDIDPTGLTMQTIPVKILIP